MASWKFVFEFLYQLLSSLLKCTVFYCVKRACHDALCLTFEESGEASDSCQLLTTAGWVSKRVLYSYTLKI